MAREGKKLELYEILAAKRAKGKTPLGLETGSVKQANSLEPDPPPPPPVAREERKPSQPEVIVDDAIAPEIADAYRQQATIEPPAPTHYQKEIAASPPREWGPERRTQAPRIPETPEAPKIEPRVEARPEPRPEPRPRSPRELVFTLEIGLIFFSVAFALVAASYFLGYKRGQEEKPVGPVAGDIESASPDRINLRDLEVIPRSTVQPPEQGYTLLLRSVPEAEAMQDRLELELSEAVTLGRQKAGFDIQGFIFRSEGASPRYYLTVGLGGAINDPELDKLRQIYTRMDGITLSRVPTPYLECRIAPIRDLGVSVY